MNKVGFEGWTTVPNSFIRNPRLSWKAKGLYLYLASRPEGWTFYLSEIVQNARDQKDAVLTGLKELTAAGFLAIERQKQPGTQRYAPSKYTLFAPEADSGFPKSGNPQLRKNDSKVKIEDIRF